jgi:hypothetical protein
MDYGISSPEIIIFGRELFSNLCEFRKRLREKR